MRTGNTPLSRPAPTHLQDRGPSEQHHLLPVLAEALEISQPQTTALLPLQQAARGVLGQDHALLALLDQDVVALVVNHVIAGADPEEAAAVAAGQLPAEDVAHMGPEGGAIQALPAHGGGVVLVVADADAVAAMEQRQVGGAQDGAFLVDARVQHHAGDVGQEGAVLEVEVPAVEVDGADAQVGHKGVVDLVVGVVGQAVDVAEAQLGADAVLVAEGAEVELLEAFFEWFELFYGRWCGGRGRVCVCGSGGGSRGCGRGGGQCVGLVDVDGEGLLGRFLGHPGGVDGGIVAVGLG